jgi:AraC family transcriptional regulator
VRVHILTQQLNHGSSVVLPITRTTHNDGSAPLVKVVGGGRGCVLKTDGPTAGIWIPLHGRLQLISGDTESVLVPGDIRVTELDSSIHAVGRGNAIWVALLGGQKAWRQVLRGLLDVPTPEPLLLPARYAADRTLKQRAITLARAMANGSLDSAAAVIIDSVVLLQSSLADSIARCPGRTYAQRRQVFLRLQRVRNYLAANCHLELDNEALARMASYSPWHFIRAFRAAYQETPHAFLVNQRLQRARGLLRTSPLAIAEIALASGFENRCAFSRLFRQRFGTTAGDLRRLERVSNIR